MAVANFQYITRMSSGFKVYILEGEFGGKKSSFISFVLLCDRKYMHFYDQYH